MSAYCSGYNWNNNVYLSLRSLFFQPTQDDAIAIHRNIIIIILYLECWLPPPLDRYWFETSTRLLQLVSNAQSTVGSEVHTKSALDWLSCANRNGPNICKIVSLEVPEMHNWSEPHKQNWCPVNYHADAIDETIEWRMRIQPWKPND